MGAQATAQTDRSVSAARLLPIALAIVALAWAVATLDRWTTDDAFISFRYAQNLVEGQGLVFNEGERVEAYSNFLWTLWIAAGLRLGAAAESWTYYWGALFYLGSIGLLVLNHALLRRRLNLAPWLIPLAALGAAAHTDWSVFATCGLETALFGFLLLAGYLIVVWRIDSPAWLAGAGLMLGLASLTRPEGILPALIVGCFVLLQGRPRIKSALSYGVPFAVVFLAFLIWRHGYYGEWLPNTFWAKSAYRSWYTQGWHYVALYFERYWPLLGAPLFWIIAAIGGRLREFKGSVLLPQTALAAALALTYTLYVVRVGGDFMFARFLIPVTPFYLLLLESGWIVVFSRWRIQGLSVVAVVLAGLLLTPAPVSGTAWRHGIANEREYYSGQRVAGFERKAEVLARYFEDLPVRVAFYGDEARVVYRARFSQAFECHSCLTEPRAAHGRLDERRRPGHEKLASPRYLIQDRKVQITFSPVPQQELGIGRYIPDVIVKFGDGVTGQLLRWDAALVAELERRGAQVPPFMRMLDAYIAQMGRFEDERVAADYERFKRFYFDPVGDPEREAAFRRRLESRSP